MVGFVCNGVAEMVGLEDIEGILELVRACVLDAWVEVIVDAQ